MRAHHAWPLTQPVLGNPPITSAVSWSSSLLDSQASRAAIGLFPVLDVPAPDESAPVSATMVPR